MVRLVPAVDQNIGVRLELRRRHVEVDLLGVSAPSVAEGLDLHDDEIEIGFRRRPACDPNRMTRSGSLRPRPLTPSDPAAPYPCRVRPARRSQPAPALKNVVESVDEMLERPIRARHTGQVHFARDVLGEFHAAEAGLDVGGADGLSRKTLVSVAVAFPVGRFAPPADRALERAAVGQQPAFDMRVGDRACERHRNGVAGELRRACVRPSAVRIGRDDDQVRRTVRSPCRLISRR